MGNRPGPPGFTILGLGLGYLYLATGSLPAVMLAHGLYDLLVLWWGRRTTGR